MNNMKKILHFTSQIEAHIVVQSLRSHGYNAEIVGGREYLSLVLGGDAGKYDILVNESDAAEALKFFEKTKRESQLTLVGSEESAVISSRSYLSKAVIFSLLSMTMFPLVFNIVAIMNLVYFWSAEKDLNKKILATTLVSVLQATALWFMYYFYMGNL